MRACQMKRRSTASNSAWPSVGIRARRTTGKITVVTIPTPPIHMTTAMTWTARAIARSFITSITGGQSASDSNATIIDQTTRTH